MSVTFLKNWSRLFLAAILLLGLTFFVNVSYAHAQVGEIASAVGGFAVDAIGSVILTFTTFLLAIAGVLFNLVVVKLVFQFADVIGNSPGLLLSWRMLRDLGNMALLFGFIFIGIATLLGIAKYSYKQALPKLIIVAVAMNFSLFVAEAVIDTSNAFAAVMYEQASQGSCPLGEDTLQAGADGDGFDQNLEDLRRSECLLNYGIAGSLMEATGLAEILTIDFGVGNGSIPVYLGLSLFALIGAVVLFAAAIMLMVRAVTLTFVMITAPLGFAAMAIPPLQPQARKWWDYLLKQSFFAPILILLLLISIKVTETFSASSGQLTLAGALTQPNASAMGIILVFMLVIGFLIASLIVAKSMGAVGSNFAIKTAGNTVFGATAWAGRNTGGRMLNYANAGIRKSAFGQTRVGRRVALVAEKGAASSFDLRGTKAAGMLGKKVGDLGKPQKGGYSGAVEEKAKAYKKYSDSLQQTKANKEREAQLKRSKDIVVESKNMEREAWDKEREERLENIRDLKAAKTKADKARNDELRIQEQRLFAAIRSGEKDIETAERKKYDDMVESHKTLAEEQDAAIKAADGELKNAQEGHRKNVEDFNKRINEIDTQIKGDIDKGIAGVDKDSSKRQYSVNLKKRSEGTLSRITGSRNITSKAAEKIKSDLKKSKQEKLLEEIKSGIDSNTGKEDEVKGKLDEVKGSLDEGNKKGGDE